MLHTNCPSCKAPISSQDLNCGNCGINLAVAAMIAEGALTLRPTGVPLISPEVLVPRIGDYLLDQGVITREDLQKAVQYKETMLNQGEEILIGQAMTRLGIIDQPMLDQAVTTQIFQLQELLHRSNNQLEERVKTRTSDLQKAIEKISSLNKLKTNLMANISHELRTPMTHIKGYLELLNDGSLGDLNREQAEALQVMTRASSRLERLIEDLITFSDATKGDLNFDLEPTLIPVIINSVVARHFSTAEKKRIRLETSFPSNLPLVLSNEKNLTWVLYQLVDNAIKFTPELGVVKVDASNNDGMVTISVTDTGIGIASDRLEEIFEPFHQLDSSATRRYGGTGLGLALVSRIIQVHNTSIQVASEVGKGSCFWFTLAPA